MPIIKEQICLSWTIYLHVFQVPHTWVIFQCVSHQAPIPGICWWPRPSRSICHHHFQLNDKFFCKGLQFCHCGFCFIKSISQSLYSEVWCVTTWCIFSGFVGRVHLPRFFFPFTLHQRINNNANVNTKMTPRSLVQNPGRAHSTSQGTGLITVTPRLLIQDLGRVYSMPQGTGLKFLEIVAHLPTWMASASYEVECSGLTMYDTPSILAQLGECDICVITCCQARVLSIQPANSSDTKACISLRLVRPHTCRLGF